MRRSLPGRFATAWICSGSPNPNSLVKRRSGLCLTASNAVAGSYVCPSEIPLVDYYRFAKSEIWAAEREKKSGE